MYTICRKLSILYLRKKNSIFIHHLGLLVTTFLVPKLALKTKNLFNFFKNQFNFSWWYIFILVYMKKCILWNLVYRSLPCTYLPSTMPSPQCAICFGHNVVFLYEMYVQLWQLAYLYLAWFVQTMLLVVSTRDSHIFLLLLCVLGKDLKLPVLLSVNQCPRGKRKLISTKTVKES